MILRIFLSILSISLLALSSWADKLEGVEFSYSGPNGTEQWENLSSACTYGKNQFPVDTKKDVVVQNKVLKSLHGNYNSLNAYTR